MAKKLYYKIGEACKLVDIKPYVLRYWETEFPLLSPSKSKSGQRVYSRKEVGIIRRIKELLYDEGYTIAGAKKKLEAEIAAGGPGSGGETAAQAEEAPPQGEDRFDTLRSGVESALAEARELLAMLDRPATD